MNRLYDMVLGEFVDEPEHSVQQLDWAAQASWTQLQLVPVMSTPKVRTMPPELAHIPVSDFLAAQGH